MILQNLYNNNQTSIATAKDSGELIDMTSYDAVQRKLSPAARVRFADTEKGDLLQTDIDAKPLTPSQLALKTDVTRSHKTATSSLKSPVVQQPPTVTFSEPSPGRDYVMLLRQTKAVYDQLLADKQVSDQLLANILFKLHWYSYYDYFCSSN